MLVLSCVICYELLPAAATENLLDPAHVVVSHHNIMGNRYKDAVPLQISTVEPVTTTGGFKVEVSAHLDVPVALQRKQ